ncbi:MAG: DUF429 domain-containing protein [Candidatus Aenigmatarchaeota archaeon]
MYRNNLIFCGIDLAGSEKRISGIAFLDKYLNVRCYSVFSNEEIIEKIEKFKPIIISIDAPLSLPKGRKSLEEKSNIHFRKCDLELRKLKIKFFPLTLGPMRKLTERGIFLKKLLTKNGYKVLETFPGAFYDLNKIDRKNFREILNFFKKILNIKSKIKNLHELDAITCAYISYLYYNGKTKEIGEKEEGTIVIPRI